MTKIKEYYPALVTREYHLGTFYMFIRNTTFKEKKIPDIQKQCISDTVTEKKSALDLDKTLEEISTPSLDLENNEVSIAMGSLDLDLEKVQNEDSGVGGGLDLDYGIKLTESFESYKKQIKRFGKYSYEAGKIIGVNEKDEKIYVQFADTPQGYCHIYKMGIASDKFDRLDKLIQKFGK